MPIRVAVASDDGKSIKDGPFHEAKYFVIYELLGRSPTRADLRVNSRRENRRGPVSVLEILRDVEVLVAKEFDDEMREITESRGIITVETDKDDVEAAVMEIAEKLSRMA